MVLPWRYRQKCHILKQQKSIPRIEQIFRWRYSQSPHALMHPRGLTDVRSEIHMLNISMSDIEMTSLENNMLCKYIWVTCAENYTRDCWQHICRRDLDCLCIDPVYLFFSVAGAVWEKSIWFACRVFKLRTWDVRVRCIDSVEWRKKKYSWNCPFYLHVELRWRFWTDWMKFYRIVVFI